MTACASFIARWLICACCEAPAAWLTYLRGGSARNLCRVAHHNHQDVVTLALLMQRLVQAEADDREVLAFEEAP